MSLLDDVSIVVTPNGYKAGTLFAVKPTIAYGSELVVNGDFSEGDTGWTIEAVWTISGGAAHGNGASGSSQELKQTILEVGKTYEFSYEIRNRVSGSVELLNSGLGATTSNQVYTGIGIATSTELRFRPSSFNGDIYNVSVREFTGADMDVTRATDATRVDEDGLIEDVLANVPRIDYTGGGCPHILAEPQRTNVNTYSEDFSQSFYIKDSGISVATTNNVSPSGESNATEIEVDNNGRIYANVASDTYSTSVFIKAGTFAYFKFQGSNVDLEAGTYSGGTIESFGNGWFKITKQYTGNRPFQIQAYPDGTYSSHTTNGNYYIWASQIEVGEFPTSYIPTSGSTVTRNQDIFTRDGIGSLINSTEGVLFVEIAALSNDSTRRSISLSDGTNTNRVVLRYDNASNRVQGFIQVGGATNGNINDNSYTITNFLKIAYKWKAGDFALWINGTEVATSTSATSFGAGVLTEMQFNEGDGAGGEYFGKVKQLQVYDTILEEEQLIALTT